MSSLLIFLLVLLPLGQIFQLSDARIYTLEMHHRFSEPVKMWSRGSGNGVQKWPVEGSLEYYEELAKHDRLLKGRHLSEYEGPLTFSDGNSTFRISSLGFLHYTTVALGTPGVKFMVALDTGSDLFWVPCECGRCASIDDSFHNQDFELSIYSPNASLTSKEVTCSNNLCTHHATCLDTFTQCPYSISYVSSETSTSGILVEDVLHLKSEHDHEGSLEAFITFGCGQVQTGSFLDVAAPNGLFGLGFEKISVPSILSQKGYTANSFSMCFGHDGRGRINFGDEGSLDQEETPFNVDSLHPTYNISVTQIRVGTALINSEFTALFDSGTSFTYLVEPTYSRILESFHSQARDKRHQTDARIPFEYCYDMSPDSNTSLIPSLSLTMKGGSRFTVYDPIIVISTQHQLIYCLAVVKSEDYSIIGQNFMTGYRIVFDREKLVLGWKKFNCYDIEESTAAKAQNSTSVPPAVAVGIGSNSSLGNNTSEKSIASSSFNLICLYLQSIIFLAVVFL
ncbi:OLC1v1011119C4 [Oldenlandia corymbosa var. corymbosa]|uniref:OLC1v1011119C4 n=1 Tax=Oldenlandia corymbosa var. corymbosa TaxID=529605 RepID=A0AAV1DSW8_OLDCO|nr:OLC1v1011119C4 [Oldenlandia corymbosa var. corymbosa]